MGLKFLCLWLIGAFTLAGCSCGSPFKRGEQLESASESYMQPLESPIDSALESE